MAQKPKTEIEILVEAINKLTDQISKLTKQNDKLMLEARRNKTSVYDKD